MAPSYAFTCTLFGVLLLFSQNPSIQAQFNQNNYIKHAMSRAVLLQIGGSTGSGFIMTDSLNDVYLITVRHNVHNRNSQGQFTTDLKGKILMIKYYSYDHEIEPINTLLVDLEGLQRNKLLGWPPDGSDIIAARIGTTVDSTSLLYYNQFTNKTDSTSRPINVIDYPYLFRFAPPDVGTEVFIVGYPTSLGFDRPALRRGILAARYRSPNILIIDCPSFPGNSGGPVYMTFEGPIINNKRYDGFGILGIVSRIIPYEERWRNNQYDITNIEYDNSGYTIVEPIKKVTDLIRSMK